MSQLRHALNCYVCGFNDPYFSACFRTLRDSEVRAVSRRVDAARKDLSIAEVRVIIWFSLHSFDDFSVR